MVTCMQFLVKDANSLASNLFTRVNVVDAGNFFGLKPKDIQGDDKKLKSLIQMLERFNVWVEASVHKKDGQLFIATEQTSLKKFD